MFWNIVGLGGGGRRGVEMGGLEFNCTRVGTIVVGFGARDLIRDGLGFALTRVGLMVVGVGVRTLIRVGVWRLGWVVGGGGRLGGTDFCDVGLVEVGSFDWITVLDGRARAVSCGRVMVFMNCLAAVLAARSGRAGIGENFFFCLMLCNLVCISGGVKV